MHMNDIPSSQFSWKGFWISFVYEGLPPAILSPIAALLIKRSFVRTWNVCQQRGLLALSLRYNPLPFILFSWLVVNTSSWLVTLGLIAVALSDATALSGIPLCRCYARMLFFFVGAYSFRLNMDNSLMTNMRLYQEQPQTGISTKQPRYLSREAGVAPKTFRV